MWKPSNPQARESNHKCFSMSEVMISEGVHVQSFVVKCKMQQFGNCENHIPQEVVGRIQEGRVTRSTDDGVELKELIELDFVPQEGVQRIRKDIVIKSFDVVDGLQETVKVGLDNTSVQQLTVHVSTESSS